MTRRRVLFVDDEVRLLEGLERTLRIRNPGWEAIFTADPHEGLEHVRGGEVDVIVTDMRMPAMSGLQLLSQVRACQPKTIRFVLSGYAEEAAVVASLSMTHQFLAKPIGAVDLIAVVDRACELQDMLGSEELCAAVGRVGSLPLRPSIYEALIDALAMPAISIQHIARLIEQDIALTAKLLQVVNSAFAGKREKTVSVTRAVSYIGIDMLKSLLVSLEQLEPLTLDLDREYRHAALVAELAREMCAMADQPELADHAFAAGMLHDIGKLIAATQLTGDQACHAEIGAYLLGAWGMPDDVVDAVAHHHRPRTSSTGALDVSGAVYAANRLTSPEPELDPAWLESVAGAARLDEWRDLAAELAATSCPRP